MGVVSAPITDRATVARCHRNYAEAFWQYSKNLPGASRRSIGGGTAIRTDLLSTIANVWFLPQPDGAIEAAFGEAVAFFGPKTPWRVITDGPAAAEVGRAAEARRLQPAKAEPGMVLTSVAAAPAPPPELRIRAVVSRPDLAQFQSAWCRSFGIPRFVFRLVLPEVLVDDPTLGAQTRLFVGLLDGRPVACSSVVVTERVAGIVSVGTTRDARGRGYGTALTHHAVAEGRSLGADVAFLAASPMGYPVYLRMGFQRAFEYPSWTSPVGFVTLLRGLYGMWRASRHRPG